MPGKEVYPNVFFIAEIKTRVSVCDTYCINLFQMYFLHLAGISVIHLQLEASGGLTPFTSPATVIFQVHS